MCDNCTMIQKCTVVHFYCGSILAKATAKGIVATETAAAGTIVKHEVGRKRKERQTMSDRKSTETLTTGPAGTGKLTKRENLAQVVKFALFSVSAGIIETVAFTVLDLATGWSYWPCYLIALILSVVWNFTLNREFTFKSANNVPVAMMKVAAFYCVFTPLSTWWGHALTSAGWNEYVVLLGTMAVNLTTEFLYDRFFVFRDSMNTNQRAQAGKKARAGKEAEK